MKKYKTFLLEQHSNRSDTTILSPEKTVDLILDNCKKFNFDDIHLYRDMNSEFNLLLIDPIKIERKSAYTKNFYTYIIDNSNSWENYPKRKNSIICSINYYRDYIVIPYDGAIFGVCPFNDLWGSFKKITEELQIHSLYTFNSLLNDLYFYFFNTDLDDSTKDIYFDNLDKLTNAIKDNDILDKRKVEDIVFWADVNLFNKMYQYFKKFKSVREALDTLFYPEDFKLLPYTSLPKDKNLEVWTESKCILIHENEIYNIKKLLNKKSL
jgi:hypothetical protein